MHKIIFLLNGEKLQVFNDSRVGQFNQITVFLDKPQNNKELLVVKTHLDKYLLGQSWVMFND